MTDKKFNVYLDLGSSKIRVVAFNQNNQEETITIEKECISSLKKNELNLLETEKKIEEVIFELEKKTGVYLKNINLLLDTQQTLRISLSISKNFEGKIMQKPPIFSALKREGKRLYQHAREGTNIKVKAREVEVEKFEITDINIPFLEFKVSCGKGTYIRSLAHDFGRKLKCGAYLTSLTREQIGSFKLDSAYTIDHFQEKILK